MKGLLRDIKYYLTSKAAKEIYGITLTIIFMGTMWTHIIMAGSFIKNDVDGKKGRISSSLPRNKVHYEYCSWQPERGLTSIYWVIEYIPRKITCNLWLPFGWEKKMERSTTWTKEKWEQFLADLETDKTKLLRTIAPFHVPTAKVQEKLKQDLLSSVKDPKLLYTTVLPAREKDPHLE